MTRLEQIPNESFFKDSRIFKKQLIKTVVSFINDFGYYFKSLKGIYYTETKRYTTDVIYCNNTFINKKILKKYSELELKDHDLLIFLQDKKTNRSIVVNQDKKQNLFINYCESIDKQHYVIVATLTSSKQHIRTLFQLSTVYEWLENHTILEKNEVFYKRFH